jgi:hypothetical protein
MTDQTITPEQRAAWQRLVHGIDGLEPTIDPDVALIAPLLPSSLTDPQPSLPTEPGWYIDSNNAVWVLDRSAGWRAPHSERRYLEDQLVTNRPFRRMVPERPQIDREKLIAVLYGLDGRDYALTEDGRYADAILALVNGTDRD